MRPRAVSTLPGVSSRQSAISVAGPRGVMLVAAAERPLNAFLVPPAGEFAHLHPKHYGSLNVVLPPALTEDAVAKGWAVAHPLAGIRLARGMVLGCRPRTELPAADSGRHSRSQPRLRIGNFAVTRGPGRHGRGRRERRRPLRNPGARTLSDGRHVVLQDGRHIRT